MRLVRAAAIGALVVPAAVVASPPAAGPAQPVDPTGSPRPTGRAVGVTPHDRASPIDLAALAAPSKTVEVAEEPLRAALVKGAPDEVVFSAVLDLGGGMTAVAWSECSKAGCRGSLATLSGGAEHPRLARRAALVAPAKVFFADGFVFEPPGFADLDGDGASEIILRYTTTEPPRKALGSLSRDHVAVHSPKDLSVMFSHELRRTGGDAEDACQWTLGRSGDRLIANGECNVRACLEATPPAGCKPTRKLVETWRKAAGQKRYSRIAAPASKTPAP